MLILNKASVELCRIRRSRSGRVEVGLRYGERLFYPCGSFAATEMHEATDFYRSCPGSSLIVSDGEGYQVWCHLPNIEAVESTPQKQELTTAAA